MMKRSVRCLIGVLAVLLAGATAQAELKLVVNFDGLTGNPDGQACNGVLGGTLDTESEATGNSSLPAQDGSTTMAVIGHSSGTLARAIGFGGIDNPIDDGETGIGFFRFMMAASGNVRAHAGLISDTTNSPVNATNTADPKTIPVGFKLVENGPGFDLATTDGATVLKAGLRRTQWYNVWIVADNAGDVFDLYLSEAARPAGAATLPTPQDLVQSGIPFGVATAGPLTGMIFANPTGTGQATRIYVDEIWWDGDQGLSKPTKARNPSPADKALDVPRDVILGWTPATSATGHNVYFGTSRADVDSAATDSPLGVLVSQGQDANTYDPAGLLELGRTYYWRVDEVNAASAVFKGDVWSFTAEPVSYPISNVTATASSFTESMGPEKTVDGSGLNADDQHSTEPPHMWLSATGASGPAWIQYQFGQAYKIDQLRVWNSNQVLESVLGLGAKAVTVEYSTDAAAWTTLGDFEFARAPGAGTYAGGTTVDFGGAVAKYVRLTIRSNWGGVLAQYGLSEVRFFYLPVLPREPFPAVAQTGVAVDAVLSWRAGREAASHQVRLSTDRQAVIDGTAPAKTVAENRFDPGAMEFGTTYFWKVVEVNEAAAPAAWEGDVWSFTTKEYEVVDDIESYNDDDNRIYDAWIDGWVNKTGSQVGYEASPFAEKTIIHGGKQSMPLLYDNADSPFYSEAEREFLTLQDWTVHGADTLSLWVRGNPVAYMEEAGRITMSAAGHDIWDNADDFRFAHKTVNGNASILVKVESLTNTNAWAKAGVMVRQSLEPDSKFVYFVVSYSSGVSLGWRQLMAGPCASVNQAGIATPQWVKFTRTGDAFTAQYCADGKTWIDLKNADGTVASTTVTMTNPAYIGLCVTSHNTAATTTAVMSGAVTSGNVTGSSWQALAIGDDPQPANNPADLYVALQDSAGKVAAVANPTATTTAAWTQWKIPLSGFAGVNMAKVKKMSIGVGSKAAPVKGDAGIVYIDDIGFGRPAAQ